MAVNGIQPTVNLRLAQAYGTRPLQTRPQHIRSTNAITPIRPVAKGVGNDVRNEGVDGFDSGLSVKAATILVRQQIDSFARTAIAPKVLRVVGGRVPDSIDFTSPVPIQSGNAGNTARAAQVDSTFQMYRHPADRNDAATGINLGGLIDLDA